MEISTIQTAGYFVMMLALIFSFWRMGGNTASAQVIDTYKEQVSQLTAQVADLTTKVGVLTGQLREKDERIKTLEAIATNRNPEMEAFIKSMNEALAKGKDTQTKAEEYMQNSTEYLHEIKNLLTVAQLDGQLRDRQIKNSRRRK